MLEIPDNQGPSRGDPAPPPPSPVVTHPVGFSTKEPSDKQSEWVDDDAIPSQPPNPDVQLNNDAKSTTLDLLEATSVSLIKTISAAASDIGMGEAQPTIQQDSSSQVIMPKEISPALEEEDVRPGQYRLKWIKFKGNKLPIITQNENGPCPLIAIMNVLLLKGHLRLPSMIDIISSDQLMEYLGDFILGSVPNNLTEGQQLNFEQNMMDAIAILPKLQTGLDVNVRFSSISDFEFTPELIVFDLLHIRLHHGWLVEPFDNIEMSRAISSCSYNQLVDKIINQKSSLNPELVTEALMAEDFLETTASQLTYYGLEELVHHVKPDDPCVLFRNNHFITLYKHNQHLYQLVTDQGFLSESNVIWETLNNIEGDGIFVDEDFNVVPPKVPQPVTIMTLEEMRMQEDQDYLLALTLQEEYKKEAELESQVVSSSMEGLTDEEIAKKLQLQEEAHQQQPKKKNLVSPTNLDNLSSNVLLPRPSSSHSTSRVSPRQPRPFEQSSESYHKYGSPKFESFIPQESRRRNQSNHFNQQEGQIHFLTDRPSSASTQRLHHSSGQRHDSFPRTQAGGHKRTAGDPGHHSEGDPSDRGRSGGRNSKSNCSLM